MASAHIPPAHLTRYTSDPGKVVWEVVYKGFPLCAPTDERTARIVWEEWRNQGSQSFSAKDFPEHAPVYDGDAGRFLD